MSDSPSHLRFQRLLIKISGEALMGQLSYGLDIAMMNQVAEEVAKVHRLGVEICLVIGGGNIFRGVKAVASGMDRTTGDYMGMLATVMNALAMQSVLERHGIATRVQSAIAMPNICEPFIRRRAIRHMEKGRVVIFAAGTGNPYFTTDTGAALRASEMQCQALIKATKVNGVYDCDPQTNPQAKRYTKISYQQVLEQGLTVLDTSAIAMCRDNAIPILVCSLYARGELEKIAQGRGEYTEISA